MPQVQMKNVRSMINPMTTAADSTMRGLSSALWADCPCFDYQVAGDMIARFWNTNSGTTADWTVTQAASGVITVSSVQMGAALLDAESTVKGSGIISAQLIGEPVFAATAAVSSAREIWFEARLRFAAIGGDCQNMLVGLCDVDTSLIDSAAALAASNMLAFHNVNANTAVFAGEKAGTSASVASAHTYVASTWVKLGFHVIATSAGVPTAYCYVNGVANSATITSANVPTVGLIPSIAAINSSAGGSQVVMELDWIAYGGRLGSSDVIATNA